METQKQDEPRAKRAAPLSPLELEALFHWRSQYGHTWKAALRKSWDNHVYGWTPAEHTAALHGLRNRLGPTWLARFNFGSDHIR